MREWLKSLFSSDESEVSALHVVFVLAAFAMVLPVIAVTIMAALAREPFTQTAPALAGATRTFGEALSVVFGGVGGAWFLRGKGGK